MRFPPQIKFIIGNEAAERFSFYGMRSILTVFMVSHLMVPTPGAEASYHLFVGACYLMPLLGGYISDHFWGKYKTILWLSLFYCLGHGVLSIWENRGGLYVGMALIALGSGGIKPCVSAFVGDQFTKENKHLVSKVYDLFYWSVNFGSFFATLLIPWTLHHFGPHWAFGIPGILMALATFVFWLGTKHYVRVLPIRKSVVAISPEEIAEKAEGKRALWGLVKVFATVSIFWALYDQYGSSWVLQGQKMNPHFFGIELDPEQLQALNPILILIMIPLFTYVLYPFVNRKLKINVTPLRKMATGMFVTALSFLIVAFIQNLLDHGIYVNLAWQAVPYFFITAAEILISITGLEFAYTQAPKSMKSTIMSFWLITVFLGNMLTAFVSGINIFKGTAYFLFFTGLMLVVSFVFTFSATRYKGKEYLEN